MHKHLDPTTITDGLKLTPEQKKLIEYICSRMEERLNQGNRFIRSHLGFENSVTLLYKNCGCAIGATTCDEYQQAKKVELHNRLSLESWLSRRFCMPNNDFVKSVEQGFDVQPTIPYDSSLSPPAVVVGRRLAMWVSSVDGWSSLVY